MILASQHRTLPNADAPTLDTLFRRAALRQPYAIALCDPPDRAALDGTPPRQLNYIAVDHAVSAIALKLRRLGLGTDAVVAFQLPNTVESVLMLLGVIRAGMIAAPLPLLWRREEIVPALARCGATMLVTASRIGATDHAEIAMQAAAAHFPIRHVGMFGPTVVDGFVAFDDVLDGTSAAPPPVARKDPAAGHVAVVTFDAGPSGLVAYARSHAQLLAAGCTSSRGKDEASAGRAILTPVAMTSFAGLALSLVPWLTRGACLALHQPFDDTVFAAQRAEHSCDTVIVPGPAVEALENAGLLKADHGLTTVIALWRSAEQWRNAPRWRAPLRIVDRLALDETALLALRRDQDGSPLPLDFSTQQDLQGDVIALRDGGYLAVRGGAVPDAAFPPGAERSLYPHLTVNAEGFTLTPYPCNAAGALSLAGVPAGLAQCGGYHFRLAEIDARLRAADPAAQLAALPHRLLGSRLAVSAQDTESVSALLQTMTPLIGDAFSPRAA